MTGKRVVVPFERPADYWRFRARRHDTLEKKPAAAKMLRKALEKSGDPLTAVELARVYLDMGCFTAAERCLARAVARGGLTGDVCFLIGCCAMNRGNMALAEDALDLCQRLDPDGDCADQAQDLLESMPYARQETRRSYARSEVMSFFARDALARGDEKTARIWAEKAWKRGKGAQTALLLGALQDEKEAIPFFRFAARRTPQALQPKLLLMLAARRAGNGRLFMRTLREARGICRGITDCESFCASAWEAGKPREALELVTERLEEMPASVDFLHLKYLCLKRLGDESGARRTLETLLDIDPDDAAGLWYRRHPEEDRLYEGRRVLLAALGAYMRSVPPRLRFGRLNRLLHWLTMALRDEVDVDTVYRLALPLWRCMPESEKQRSEESRHLSMCMMLDVLARAGQKERAKQLFDALPHKRRIRRTLRRFAQWRQKERETHALHQF